MIFGARCRGGELVPFPLAVWRVGLSDSLSTHICLLMIGTLTNLMMNGIAFTSFFWTFSVTF